MSRVTSPATGGLRALRAGLLATACVSLALAAHTAAGGHAPAVLALLTATVAVGCGALLLTGRRLAAPTAVVALVGVQAALHLWFAVTAGGGCAVSGALTHAHGLGPCAVAAGAAVEHAPASGPAPAGLLMLLAHLTAVVLLALGLARGDALLWRLAGLLPRRVPTPAVVVLGPAMPATGRTAGRLLPLAAPVAWRRRGPPAAAAAR